MRLLIWLPLALGSMLSGFGQGTLLVPRGSVWKYQNLNQDLTGSGWEQPGYVDTAWPGSGIGPLGDNNELGTQLCTTVIDIGPVGTRYPVVYFRRSFNVASAAAFQSLTLRLNRDDTAVVYLNGQVLLNDGVPEPVTFTYSGGTAAAGADEVTYFEHLLPATGLVNGVNVLAVEVHQQAPTSSDLQFDLELEGANDTTAPTVIALDPTEGSSVLDLTFINVIFSETVLGVNASDLLINGSPATRVATNNPNDFTFFFTRPPTGAVQVAWAPGHGITDASPSANPFAGGSWNYTFDPNATRPIVLISEFMADNEHGLQDEDGARSDWIELANLGTLPSNLDGWFLTDDSTNLTKWRFPAAVLDANKYMIVFASAKDRTSLNGPLHTNFRLSKSASYLALVDSRTNVVSEFNPYPAQQADVSYGRDRVDPGLVGYFSPPTPGSQNTGAGAGFAPDPVFSLNTGIYTNDTLTLTITAASGTIRYTVNGSLPATNSPIYTGPMTFGTNVVIKARVFPAGGGLLPSRVLARSFIFLDATTRDFNSNLPLMILSTAGKPIGQNIPPGGTRTNGAIVVIDTINGRSSLRGSPEVHELAGFEIFGQTSPGFGIVNGVPSKLPYRIEIQDEFGNDLKVSVLGAPPESDFKLRNPYDDRTLINDFLAAELHGQMGHYNLRPKLVEVFVDTGGGRLNYQTDYSGVQVLFDVIGQGKDRVDIAELTPYATNEPAISGGWMIKYDKESAGDLNIRTVGGGGFQPLGVADTRLKIHEPKPSSLRALNPVSGPLTAVGSNQVRWLTNWLAQMEHALYAADWTTRTGTNHYSYYLDPDSFVDFHWMVEFTKQIDGYRLSNFMQKDRGGRLKTEPIWDWNLSLGNADYLDGGHTNRWYYEDTGELDHPWLRRLITGSPLATANTGDPEFTQKIADRWAVLRTNILNGPRVLARIDELSIILSNAAVRDFGHYKTLGSPPPGPSGIWPCPAGPLNHDGTVAPTRPWDVDYTTPTNYMSTTNSIIGYMKKWVLGRYLWIDSQ
ncbi:MAG TPA: CotH kinase family protein, partial [Candidatus Saccharimonadales bacterium]|nr:CotH kinase family protein [Candidatus Saccharimonadales bacterium]